MKSLFYTAVAAFFLTAYALYANAQVVMPSERPEEPTLCEVCQDKYDRCLETTEESAECKRLHTECCDDGAPSDEELEDSCSDDGEVL